LKPLKEIYQASREWIRHLTDEMIGEMKNGFHKEYEQLKAKGRKGSFEMEVSKIDGHHSTIRGKGNQRSWPSCKIYRLRKSTSQRNIGVTFLRRCRFPLGQGLSHCPRFY